MIDADFLKRKESDLLAQWDKKLALKIQIEDLEIELKEFTEILGSAKDKNSRPNMRLELSIIGLQNRIERLKKNLYST